MCVSVFELWYNPPPLHRTRVVFQSVSTLLPKTLLRSKYYCLFTYFPSQYSNVNIWGSMEPPWEYPDSDIQCSEHLKEWQNKVNEEQTQACLKIPCRVVLKRCSMFPVLKRAPEIDALGLDEKARKERLKNKLDTEAAASAVRYAAWKADNQRESHLFSYMKGKEMVFSRRRRKKMDNDFILWDDIHQVCLQDLEDARRKEYKEKHKAFKNTRPLLKHHGFRVKVYPPYIPGSMVKKMR